MRHSASLIAVLALALAGCGGKDAMDTSPSLMKRLTGNTHSCASPAPSGSAEQVACHTAARAACPEGTAPNQVDFSEESGEFLVKGYSCV